MKFSKKIVVFCIIFVTIYTIAQIYMSYKLHFELSPTLTTCFYAFFGTELASCACIRIFDREKEVEEKKDEEKRQRAERRLRESKEPTAPEDNLS